LEVEQMSTSMSTDTSGRDRRLAPRYSVELPARYWSELLEFEGRVELTGEVSDVSWGGLFVRCEFLEPPGTPVSLLVTLPESAVPLKGHVAWVAEEPPKGPGMGIRLAAPLGGSLATHIAPLVKKALD
jgi:hypothetical protein